MATGTEASILSAMLAHLSTLTFTPALAIAYPGVNFPAAGQTKPDNYLSVSFIPNRTDTLSVGEGHQRHQGLLQVSVYWKAGAGIVKPLEVADKVIQHFAKGTRLRSGGVTVQINRKPWASGPLQEPGYVQIPVTIPYTSFNQ